MDIQDRIGKIGKYFRMFNIINNIGYVLVNFPKEWTLPENVSDYGVNATSDEKGTYFYFEITEKNKDINALFDCVDFTVAFNQSIEEKAQFFKEKAEELKNIIYSTPIEKLRTLEFVMKTVKTKRKYERKKKDEPNDNDVKETIEGRKNDNDPLTDKNKNKEISLLEVAKSIIQ